MVKVYQSLQRAAGNGISKTLMELLVCPLSKQPLRYCEATNSLVSDAIGVSYPIKNGIPCLVPLDWKLVDADEDSKTELATADATSTTHKKNPRITYC